MHLEKSTSRNFPPEDAQCIKMLKEKWWEVQSRLRLAEKHWPKQKELTALGSEQM